VVEDHSGSAQFTNALTDQEYLVARAREAGAQGDEWSAKTWMLTAKNLFPDNFGIQFEAYTTEKESGNAKDSATFFQDLFNKFPTEQRIVTEIAAVMDVLNKANDDNGDDREAESKFYADMFEHIGEAVQKKMILQAAENAKDPLEHCRLMLILLRRFPDRIPQHGERLIESINTAERHELEQVSLTPLNMFRRMLVVDVLPTVLKADGIKLNPKLVLRNLLKTQEFVVAYVNRRSNTNNTSGIEVRGDPWQLLYSVLLGVGRALGWPESPPPSPVPGVEEFLASMGALCRAGPPPDSPQGQQLFHSTSSCCLHAVFQYAGLLREKEVLLVEAFVTHDTSDTAPKRRKLADDASSALPLVTHGTSATMDDPLIHAFQVACTAWQLVTSSSTLESRFQSLVVQLSASAGPLNLVTQFSADYYLLSGKLREALADVRQLVSRASEPEPWHSLKLATVYHCLGDRRMAAQSLAECICLASQLGGGEGTVGGLTWPTAKSRHLRFLPLTRGGLIAYCCRLVTAILQEKALQHNAGGDLAMGHILVVLQYNWPDQRELFNMMMHRVKKKESFSYPLFAQYVVNIDILEEIMYLSTEQGGGVALDLFPGGGAGLGGARPGTRGANRGEKEDFRQTMRRQAARSQEPVDRIIVDFFASHSDLILQCLT